MEKNKKQNLRNASISLVFLVGLIAGLVVLAEIGNLPSENERVKTWHTIAEWKPSDPVWAEADPGSGASGILSVYLHPHQATPHESYYENSSSNLETNCTSNSLGFANADDSEVDLAYDTAFDIVVRVRGNSTHCKREAVWFDTDLRVRITCTGLGIAADTELIVTGNATATANNSGYTFLYMNFWDCGSAGYTLSKDETVEITSIKFEAYY